MPTPKPDKTPILQDAAGLATISSNANGEAVIVPKRRIADVNSLNTVIDRIIQDDEPATLARVPVQEAIDGKPPFNQRYLEATGQEGRCNLNFGHAKKRIKLETAGYYDLTESVPTIALIETDFGREEQLAQRSDWNSILSEEFHRMVKEWKQFDSYFQLLVQKFVCHGVGFLYFKDEYDWRWEVAGLDDFKVPRGVGLSEEDCDIAIVIRNVPVTTLYKWLTDADDADQRWNKVEVQNAIMHANDPTQQLGPESWGLWQQKMKNNDLYASIMAKTDVRIVYAWVKEFSGMVSQFITLRNKTNKDYLFQRYDAFDNVNECYNFFPYEVGTNGTLHSCRGLGDEIYARVQVLNNLHCQAVDNAKISSSVLLQPTTETAAEDMAILFYGGAAYIPPGIDVKNPQVSNPSTNMLPIMQEMSAGLNGDVNTQNPRASEQEKTKFEVRNDIVRESVLPTAAMALFYQPWGRHLYQACTRMFKHDQEFKKRCVDRGVPKEVFTTSYCVRPYRALGFGSPSNRLAALDELMQYYGSLDPVGQNNLLRDRFAQRVTYGQVDRYVPRLEVGGRLPVDTEIAELQNVAMSSGADNLTVAGNENHIIHLQIHFPNIDQDLLMMESGNGSPGILNGIKIKAAHIQKHMETLKPDKLNEKIVAELARVFNNTIERVQAAMKAADVEAQKESESPQPSRKEQEMLKEADVKRKIKIDDAALDRELRQAAADQERAIEDADAARRIAAKANATRVLGGAAPQNPAI